LHIIHSRIALAGLIMLRKKGITKQIRQKDLPISRSDDEFIDTDDVNSVIFAILDRNSNVLKTISYAYQIRNGARQSHVFYSVLIST